jgi:hypothetical protein
LNLVLKLKTIIIQNTVAVLGAIAAGTVPAIAEGQFLQGTGYIDVAGFYYARENQRGLDNDIVLPKFALTYIPDSTAPRTFGIRSELGYGALDRDRNILLDTQVFWQTDQNRFGAGLSYDYLKSAGNGWQAALTGALFVNNWTFSGMAGYQMIEGPGPYGGSDNQAPFAVATARWYPRDWVSANIGATYEAGDALLHTGMEFYIPNSRRRSFIEFVIAPQDFRGDQFYNSLTMGFRMSDPFKSLKERDRKTVTYGFHRTISLR